MTEMPVTLRDNEKLEPLLEFRDWLKAAREKPEWRERARKNGSTTLRDGGDAWGPFTMEARQSILRRLLEAEAKTKHQLISVGELLLIQRLWQQGDRFGSDTGLSHTTHLALPQAPALEGLRNREILERLIERVCRPESRRLIRCLLNGMTLVELAEAEKVPVGTVKWRMYALKDKRRIAWAVHTANTVSNRPVVET